MEYTILVILIFTIFPIVNAMIDWNIIENLNRYVDHTAEFIFRGVVIGAASFIGINSEYDIWKYLLEYTLNVILGACMFWIIFEAFLNKFRDKDLFYRGKEADSDKFFNKHLSRTQFIILKIIVLIIAISIMNYKYR